VEIEFGTDHFGRTTQEGQHKKTPSHLTSQFPYHLYVNKNLFEIIWEAWHYSDHLDTQIQVSFENKPM